MNLPRNVRRWCGAVVLAAVTVPATLAAQMPAAPVLQNAWTNAGITAAIDYSHAQATNAWAGALAWSPRQARFQLSIGGGVIKDSLTSHGGYGARIAIPLVGFAGGSIGTGVFGGVGYSSVAGMRESNFPVGLSLGWRHALGTTRGISAYVSPYWMTARFKQDADTALNATRSLVRAAVVALYSGRPWIAIPMVGESGPALGGRTRSRREQSL